jgi:UDP:flavonoid glycosyltransferase YjiC (YdhE family)
MSPPKRILLATIGSLGDLHPMLALGLELSRRGHQITVASTEFYRGKVVALGLQFCAMRPNWDPTDKDLIAACEDLRTGPEVLIRRFVLPHLRNTYDDLLGAAADANLMIAGELCFAAPLVAEKLGLTWISAILSPTSFFSSHDPSLLVNAPWLYRFRRAGWLFHRTVLAMATVATRHWWQPVRRLRRDLGLGPGRNPILKDKFSPHLVLALFSHSLAEPQPDWPKQTVQPGFVFYDREQVREEDWRELRAFLAAGDAPIVFTLGSTAVHNPGIFFEASIAAARRLGRRALLVGLKYTPDDLGDDLMVLPYAPYSLIFPAAKVVVHQGGSGTVAQSLRAGRPQLIVPYGWDQPDNGERVRRLGAGLCLERRLYSAATATVALDRLLREPGFAAKARAAGESILAEEAIVSACDAIESVFSK